MPNTIEVPNAIASQLRNPKRLSPAATMAFRQAVTRWLRRRPDDPEGLVERKIEALQACLPAGQGGDAVNAVVAQLMNTVAEVVNADAPVPPAFGVHHTKPWKVQEATVGLVDGRELTMMLPRGMPVAKHLHAFYWRQRDYIRRMFAEADRLGIELNEYSLSKPDDAGALKLYGGGTFNRAAGEADLAWLVCAFREMDDLRFGILVPDTVAAGAFSFEGVGKATHQPTADGGFEVRRLEE